MYIAHDSVQVLHVTVHRNADDVHADFKGALSRKRERERRWRNSLRGWTSTNTHTLSIRVLYCWSYLYCFQCETSVHHKREGFGGRDGGSWKEKGGRSFERMLKERRGTREGGRGRYFRLKALYSHIDSQRKATKIHRYIVDTYTTISYRDININILFHSSLG